MPSTQLSEQDLALPCRPDPPKGGEECMGAGGVVSSTGKYVRHVHGAIDEGSTSIHKAREGEKDKS